MFFFLVILFRIKLRGGLLRIPSLKSSATALLSSSWCRPTSRYFNLVHHEQIQKQHIPVTAFRKISSRDFGEPQVSIHVTTRPPSALLQTVNHKVWVAVFICVVSKGVWCPKMWTELHWGGMFDFCHFDLRLFRGCDFIFPKPSWDNLILPNE